jgi:polysaccharide export outer membrane protein
MKFRITVAIVFCMLLMAVPIQSANELGKPSPSVKPVEELIDTPFSYIIGPGDLLDISVWKDESLSRVVYVLPDGRISFPLIGQFDAAGKTASQLKKDLQQRLLRYVPDAILTLEIKQVNSLIIYVLGRVNNPGRFVLNTNMNVMQALATAGGLNPFAKKNSIKIFRYEEKITKIFKFDYTEVADGSHLDQNIQLNRGDVILVP